MQHWRMAVGKPRALVERPAGEFSEEIEIRLDMAKQRIGQMQPQQIRQRGIGPIKIHARGVGREQSWLVDPGPTPVIREWLHFCLSFVPPD
jgi:hypothetical protein